MEHKHYKVPLSRFHEHIRSHIPPEYEEREVVVEYSYKLVPETTEEKQKRHEAFIESLTKLSGMLDERGSYEFTKNLGRDLQVNTEFLFEDIEKAGGISAQAAEEMDKNSETFRGEFSLDK